MPHSGTPPTPAQYSRGVRRYRLRGFTPRTNRDAVNLVLHWRKQGYVRTHYRHSFLYVYRADFDGSGTRYKIGVSQDPWHRIKTLVYWQIPQRLIYARYVRDAYALEAGLHAHFRARQSKPVSNTWGYVRISGKTEWFDLSPGELSEIARLADVWELVAAVVDGDAA